MCVFVWNWPLRVTHLEVMAPLGRQRATLLAQTLSLSFFALSLALSPPCHVLLTSISHVLCFIFLFLLLSTFLTLWHAGMYDINRKRKDKRCIVSGPINLSRAFSSGWPVNTFVWAHARSCVCTRTNKCDPARLVLKTVINPLTLFSLPLPPLISCVYVISMRAYSFVAGIHLNKSQACLDFKRIVWGLGHFKWWLIHIFNYFKCCGFQLIFFFFALCCNCPLNAHFQICVTAHCVSG